MTEQEQQAATRRLAEAMGWREVWGSQGFWFERPDGSVVPPWNPFTRLDDVRIVEDWIERWGLVGEYIASLYTIIVGDPFPAAWLYAHATAAQRAEACLRVIEGMKHRSDQ